MNERTAARALREARAAHDHDRRSYSALCELERAERRYTLAAWRELPAARRRRYTK